MLIVNKKHRAALRTIFFFLGATLGAMDIVERFDDRLEELSN